MKARAWLAKFPTRRAVGLCLGERELVLSRVAFTPLGPVELDRRAEPRGEGPLEPALRRLLEPLGADRAWRRAPVAVGLPTLSVFCSTRPAGRVEGFSPQVFLHEILQSANLNIDHMEVDVVRGQPGRRPVASVVACRKRLLAQVLEALADCGVAPWRVEPAPCALLRAAVARHRTPRRAATALRIFLGRDRALAVLTAADAPLMWRCFALEPGAEATAVLSTYRSVANICTSYGADAPPPVVLLHGRPDLAGLAGAEADQWRRAAVRVVHHAGPAYDAAEAAPGLALGCLPQAGGFNLARDARPPEPVLGLLPWGQVALQALALAGATWLMVDHRRALEASGRAIAAERAGLGGLEGAPAERLAAEKADLLRRAATVEGYLSGRILWAACAAEVAARLPGDMVVTSLDGHAEYAGGKGGKAQRSLALSLEAPIPQGGAVPREVEDLLDALRASPALKAVLPTVELGALRWGVSGPAQRPAASFTVLFLPRIEGARKPSG